MNNYLLNFEHIKDMSIRDLSDLITNTNGIPLHQLRVQDLAYFNGNRIFPGIGVYIFKEGIKPIYVGKCSSASFIERIPKHLDSRKVAWFHRLLELIALKKLDHKEISNETLLEASDYAFKNVNLVLIGFQEKDKAIIKPIEKLLRIALDPLNRFKTKELKNPSEKISSYLKL